MPVFFRIPVEKDGVRLGMAFYRTWTPDETVRRVLTLDLDPERILAAIIHEEVGLYMGPDDGESGVVEEAEVPAELFVRTDWRREDRLVARVFRALGG